MKDENYITVESNTINNKAQKEKHEKKKSKLSKSYVAAKKIRNK